MLSVSDTAAYLIDELGVKIEFPGLRIPLHAACFTSCVESVKFLLERGANANIPFGSGKYVMTPLLCAASTGCLETVKMLFDHRSSGKKNSHFDIEARSIDGTTALQYAVHFFFFRL